MKHMFNDKRIKELEAQLNKEIALFNSDIGKELNSIRETLFGEGKNTGGYLSNRPEGASPSGLFRDSEGNIRLVWKRELGAIKTLAALIDRLVNDNTKFREALAGQSVQISGLEKSQALLGKVLNQMVKEKLAESNSLAQHYKKNKQKTKKKK